MNAYVPNTTNPTSAPFFTSPWIRNHAIVIAKYARAAYNGELSLIPIVAYFDMTNVETNGMSISSKRVPKIKTGGTFIYCTLRFHFFLGTFVAVGVGVGAAVVAVGAAVVAVGVAVGVGVGINTAAPATVPTVEHNEQKSKTHASTINSKIIVEFIYMYLQNNSRQHTASLLCSSTIQISRSFLFRNATKSLKYSYTSLCVLLFCSRRLTLLIPDSLFTVETLTGLLKHDIHTLLIVKP